MDGHDSHDTGDSPARRTDRAASNCYAAPVVRPDERRRVRATARERRGTGCTFPAGGSPASVSVGAPSSRSRGCGEIRASQAGCRKPRRRYVRRDGEQARGPQHEVKPAASSQKQFGGRADHFTAKATPTALAPKHAAGSGGVWGVARAQGNVRNRRGPSDPSSSRQGTRYKPKVKTAAGQQESEGAIVPL